MVWLELPWWTSAPSFLGQKTGPPPTSARLRLQAAGQSRRLFLPGRAGVSPAWHGGWGFGWALRGGCFTKVSLVGGLQPFQALGRRRRRKGTRSPCQPAWAPTISLLLPVSRTQQDKGIPIPFLQWRNQDPERANSWLEDSQPVSTGLDDHPNLRWGA